MEKLKRTEKSIEWKHQNISAVLVKLVIPISGYKPASNYQRSITPAIERFIMKNPRTLTLEPSAMGFNEKPALFVEQAPILQTASSEDEDKDEALMRLVRKFDPVERDFRNRALGKAGEETVFAFERKNLETQGRPDLAGRVKWISQEYGDGAGYDILSYDFEGKERLIEVKTTNGVQTTPFYLTRNELHFSKERTNSFKLCRLYDFARAPKMFELSPPLDKLVRLEPLSFEASFE
jgi:hypothetical protein